MEDVFFSFYGVGGGVRGTWGGGGDASSFPFLAFALAVWVSVKYPPPAGSRLPREGPSMSLASLHEAAVW